MNIDTLRKIEGLQTLETVAKALNIKTQSALNLISKLKKQQYATVKGGGRKIRLYKITLIKQLPREEGMFDILNKYNPKFKLNPWYDHQVHGKYTVEDVIVDAIKTESFRAILATLRLFNHVTDWKRLYQLAKENDCWQKVGALYDVARMFIKVRKMPEKYKHNKFKKWQFFTILRKKNFTEISNKWRVFIPFNKNDLDKII